VRRRVPAVFACGLVACRAVLGIEDRPAIGGDAGADAGEVDAADAAPSGSGYCASLSPQPRFCADFDDGPLERGWQNEGRTPDPGLFGGGTIEADTTVFRSAPRSVAFATPARVAASQTAAAFLLTRIDVAPSALRLDFDLRIATEEIPSAGGGRVILASVHFAPAGAIVLFRDALGTALGLLDDTTGSGATAATSERIPVGVWKTVTIHVANMPTDGGADGWANVAVDQIVAATLPLPAAFQKVTSPPTVSVGAVLARGPVGAFRANVDDVRIDYLP
jgi:hypothetical protein